VREDLAANPKGTTTMTALQTLRIDLLRESRTNPRKTFDQPKLIELAESIEQKGLFTPILVRPIHTIEERRVQMMRLQAAMTKLKQTKQVVRVLENNLDKWKAAAAR
jgi:hypothetical protein